MNLEIPTSFYDKFGENQIILNFAKPLSEATKKSFDDVFTNWLHVDLGEPDIFGVEECVDTAIAHFNRLRNQLQYDSSCCEPDYQPFKPLVIMPDNMFISEGINELLKYNFGTYPIIKPYPFTVVVSGRS